MMNTRKEEPAFTQAALDVIQDLLFRNDDGCNLISIVLADDPQDQPLYTLFFENSENNVRLLPMSHSAPNLQFFVGFLANILHTSHEGIDYDEPIVLIYSEYPSAVSGISEISELGIANKVTTWDIQDGTLVGFKSIHDNDASVDVKTDHDNTESAERIALLKQQIDTLLASTAQDIMAFFRDIIVSNSPNGSHIVVVGSSLGQMEFMYGKNGHDIYNMEGIVDAIHYASRSLVLGSLTSIFLRSFLNENVTNGVITDLFQETSQQALRGWVFTTEGILPLSSQQVIDASCRDYETGKILDPERNLAYVDAWNSPLG